MLRAGQRGDDKARVGFALGPFRLGDDTALAAPAVARAPGKVPEAARRLAGLLAQPGGFGEFRPLLMVVAKVSSQELPLDAARMTSTLQTVSAVRRALAG